MAAVVAGAAMFIAAAATPDPAVPTADPTLPAGMAVALPSVISDPLGTAVGPWDVKGVVDGPARFVPPVAADAPAMYTSPALLDYFLTY